MLRRIAQGAALLAAMVFLAVPGWVAIHSRDLPDAGDAALLALHAQPAPGARGSEDLRAAASALDGLLDDDPSRERITEIDLDRAEDAAWIREQAAAASEARDALERALDEPGWPTPPVADVHDSEWFDELFAVLRLVRLEALAGRLALRSGSEPAAALDRILLGKRVAHVAAQASGQNLLAVVLGLTMQSISLSALEDAAASGEIPTEQEAALIARLESLRVAPDTWRRAWAGEYAFFRRVVFASVEEELGSVMPEGMPSAVRGFLPLEFLWQPNRTLAAMAERYRGYQEDAGRPCRALVDLPRSEPPARWRLVFGSNSIGRILVDAVDSDVTRFEVRRCHLETRASLLQAALAVRVHVARTGERPSSLAELVPDLLPHVPEDAYTGEPVGFSPETGQVHSNGSAIASREKSLDPAELSLSL